MAVAQICIFFLLLLLVGGGGGGLRRGRGGGGGGARRLLCIICPRWGLGCWVSGLGWSPSRRILEEG